MRKSKEEGGRTRKKGKQALSKPAKSREEGRAIEL